MVELYVGKRFADILQAIHQARTGKSVGTVLLKDINAKWKAIPHVSQAGLPDIPRDVKKPRTVPSRKASM